MRVRRVIYVREQHSRGFCSMQKVKLDPEEASESCVCVCVCVCVFYFYSKSGWRFQIFLSLNTPSPDIWVLYLDYDNVALNLVSNSLVV